MWEGPAGRPPPPIRHPTFRPWEPSPTVRCNSQDACRFPDLAGHSRPATITHPLSFSISTSHEGRRATEVDGAEDPVIGLCPRGVRQRGAETLRAVYRRRISVSSHAARVFKGGLRPGGRALPLLTLKRLRSRECDPTLFAPSSF